MLDRFAINFWVCPALWLLAVVATAQTVPPPALPSITLDEALARTLDANPALAANGYQIDAALGRVQQANVGPNPVLDLAMNDALGTDDFRGVRGAETTLSIIWVLERGVRLRQIDAALADVSLHEVEARIMQLDTAAETARRFLACLAFQARLVNAAEAIRLAGQAVEAVRARVAAGGATQAELSRAEAGLVRAQLLEEDYEHELVSANHRLSEQWGETQPDFGRALGDVQALPAVEPLDTLQSRVDRNPDIAFFMSQRRLAEAELHVARARSRPDWQLRAGVRRIEATDDFALVGEITMPFGTRDRYLGRIAETFADMARATGHSRATRERIETALIVHNQELLHHEEVAA
ncbi:MAG: TolC family protein, partial [Rhodospirillaceae bacterium]|nr:TolC family protein [Rhodospirillaceae bacterium]